MWLVVVSICCFSAKYQNTHLEGKWKMDQFVIKKTVKGNVSVKTYQAGKKIDSFIRCPEIISISSDQITFRYLDQSEEKGTYSIEGNQLKVMFAPGLRTYQFTLRNSISIQLELTVKYTIDGKEKVEEVYQLYGHRDEN